MGHIFGEGDGWIVAISGRQARLIKGDAPGNQLTAISQQYFRYPEGVGAAAQLLEGESERGRDAYLGVHLYRERGSRRASNAAETVATLWLDEDEGRLPEDGPEPTAIVRSSRARRHLYWLLERRVSTEWAVGMNRRLALWAGGDSGKAGLSTVLRLPGTRNYKRHPQVDPVTLELTGARPWSPEVMGQVVPPLPTPNRAPRHRAGEARRPYNGPQNDLSDLLEDLDVDVLGHVPDGGGQKVAVVCPWIKEHSGGDPSGTYLGQFSSGALWFHCNHDHCRGRVFKDFMRAARSGGAELRLTVRRGSNRLKVVFKRER